MVDWVDTSFPVWFESSCYFPQFLTLLFKIYYVSEKIAIEIQKTKQTDADFVKNIDIVVCYSDMVTQIVGVG